MSLQLRRVKDDFRQTCQSLAQKDLPKATEQKEVELPEVLFEGLADISELSYHEHGKKYPTEFVLFSDTENGSYCVISGRYRVGRDDEAVAIAIGLWDEKRKCFSALAKMRNGESLPPPFKVDGDASRAPKAAACRKSTRILAALAPTVGLEETLKKYNQFAKDNQ